MAGAPSVLSSWTRVILDALNEEGIDSDAVLREAGFTSDAFADPNARHTVAATRPLWRAAAEAFGDPACGLRISSYVRPTTFHALGYAVFASGTLREALNRLVRYAHLVSDARAIRLESQSGSARLAFYARMPGEPAHTPEAIDAVMSLVVRTCRTLTDRSFSLELVEQRRPVPADVTPYERFFRCPLRFECAADALTFPDAWLDTPLPTANPELARHNESLVQQYLAAMEQGTLVDQVRAEVAGRLSGAVSPATIAQALGMSQRSLQRHLSQHGTTFAAVLTETRSELARDYLRDSRWSVAEIAFLLGFDDASSFARAFRRWTHVSPSEFRARLAGEARAKANG